MDSEELRRRYKRQARNIARAMATRFVVDEARDAPRYGGNAVCPACGLEYYNHPQIEEGNAAGLNVTCQGKLVKL